MMLGYTYFPPLDIAKNHFIFNCVLVLLSLLTVALRIWCRTKYQGGIGVDDALVLIAMVSAQATYLDSLLMMRAVGSLWA